MHAWQFAKLQYTATLHGWTRFVSMQDQYSLLYREEEREMFGLLSDQGVGSMPYSPLAKGRVANPVVSAPIVGATREQHLTDAVAAVGITLTPAEVEVLERPYIPRLAVGF